MFDIVTRDNIINSKLDTRYPRLLKLLNSDASIPFYNKLDLLYRNLNAISFNNPAFIWNNGVQQQQKNLYNNVIMTLYSAISPFYECNLITNNRNKVEFIKFYDRRIGVVSVTDTSISNTDELYNLNSKHKFDLAALNTDTFTIDSIEKVILDYTTELIKWIDNNKYTNNHVIFTSQGYKSIHLNPDEIDTRLHSELNKYFYNLINTPDFDKTYNALPNTMKKAIVLKDII